MPRLLRRLLPCAALAAFSSVALPALGHIRLDQPPSRYAYSSGGQKTPMCGEGTATGVVTTFAPGETITVEWTETINHPGHFRISFDPDGGDDGLVDPAGYDDFYSAPTVLADEIIDEGGNTFSQEVTLPDVECELCTLQLIQVMTDKPPWGPAGGDDIYYWCADIRLSTTPDPTTTSSGGGMPEGGGTGDGGAASSGGAPGNGGGGASGDGGDAETDDGCAVGRGAGSASWQALAALALVAARARRSRRR
jgi:hypothetical protein